MGDPLEVPVVKFDMRGRLICPVCGDVGEIPKGAILCRGVSKACANGHWFAITDDVAFAVNDILSRSDPEGDLKRIVRNFEETPYNLKPPEERGKIIL